jgi:heat shock protein HslJ
MEQDRGCTPSTPAGVSSRRSWVAALVAPTVVCLALLALAGCGDSTNVPPHAPVTLTDATTPTGMPTGTTSPTGTPTGGTAGTSPAATVTSADLDGKTYASTTVSGHSLAHATSIELTFNHGMMAVFAGCNTMVAPYEVSGGVLRWTSPPATGNARCNAPLTAQDGWVKSTFGKDLQLSGDVSAFTLSDGTVEMQFAPKQTPALSSVLNRKWTLAATVDNGRSTGFPSGHRPATVSVAADGTARLYTGCNAGRTKVAVAGRSLSFTATTASSTRCPRVLVPVENTMLAVLRGTADAATLQENRLVLLRGSRGLIFDLS